MATKGWAAKTTQLSISENIETPVWAILVNIYSIGSMTMDRTMLDISSHDSSVATEAYWRQFIPGMYEPIDIPISCIYDGEVVGSEYETLFADLNSGVERKFKIVYPDSYENAFNGFIKSVSFESPMEDKLSFDMVVRVNNNVVYQPTV